MATFVDIEVRNCQILGDILHRFAFGGSFPWEEGAGKGGTQEAVGLEHRKKVTETDSCNQNRTATAQKLRSAKVKDKIIVHKHLSNILSKWIDSYHIYGQMIVFFDS